MFLFMSCKNKSTQQTSSDTSNQKWWKEAVVYQIYPRSFKDSDGDGVGDLKGIISKLDYIKSLGIDVVWLNPIFASPNDDNGYDISDYRSIMKEFGTMEDFDAMLKGMHERGIKLVLDLVANHSSSEHEWFKQSRSSRTNPYRDYYHWWPAERGKPAHRWSFFDVNADAWMYDSTTNAYYLHYFSRKQPDLNWENPKVRKEIFDMMNFWFDKGIDGFRMDVIPFISKDTTFPELPKEYNGDFVAYYANGPHLHEYLKEMNKEVLSKHNVMSVAEGAGVTAETAHNFVDEDRNELNMLYHFEGVSYGYVPGKFKTPEPDGYKLVGFKEIYSKWDSIFATKGWGTIYLGNHDQPRMVTRWGNDAPEFREPSSKMLTTFLLTMRATPYYYFGDELGMSNIKFDKIEDYNDIETKNHYILLQSQKGDLKAFLEAAKISARDNGRTPFQWDATANAGFTTGTPWLKVNPNYKNINVAAEVGDENSCLNYFKKAVQLRKKNKVLVYGKYQLLDKANEKVYAYTRGEGADKMLVILNFSKDKLNWDLPNGLIIDGEPLLNNYKTFVATSSVELEPYQAIVVKVK
ncbi:oligo-1,6-glucosidase [mine drainage metagenome]|uniref:Oligo-1,6-glucosidase n=1 Tax=mine drainage metagenome TaxID=410659 RepID=A0A1J5T055_9ZZZZ